LRALAGLVLSRMAADQRWSRSGVSVETSSVNPWRREGFKVPCTGGWETQAAGDVTAARARLRLARWTASS